MDLTFDLSEQDRAMLARIESKLDEMKDWIDLLAPGLTVEQAKEAMECSDSTVRRLCSSKKIRRFYEGKRVMIPVSEVAKQQRKRHIR